MKGLQLWKSCIGTVFFLGILGGLVSHFFAATWVVGAAIMMASYYLVPRVPKRAYIPVFLTNIGVGVVGWVVNQLLDHRNLIFSTKGPQWHVLWQSGETFFFSTILLISVIGAWVISMTANWSKQKQDERIAKVREERKKQRVHRRRSKR